MFLPHVNRGAIHATWPIRCAILDNSWISGRPVLSLGFLWLRHETQNSPRPDSRRHPPHRVCCPRRQHPDPEQPPDRDNHPANVVLLPQNSTTAPSSSPASAPGTTATEDRSPASSPSPASDVGSNNNSVATSPPATDDRSADLSPVPATAPVNEPGDDHGGHGELEPGDDHGGHGELEPGDDKRSGSDD